MKYDIILLDADETLMDFPDAEHQALVRTFEDHHLTLTPSIDQLYQQINSGLWKQFEQQLITRKQLLSTRFAQLFDTPVSYTHLDVYKRQTLPLPFLS